MEAETQADDDAQTTTETTYTGFDIIAHIEEGDTIRVPDRHYKSDFNVDKIETSSEDSAGEKLYYEISNPHGGWAMMWFDASAKPGNRINVGQSDFCLDKHNITLVKED